MPYSGNHSFSYPLISASDLARIHQALPEDRLQLVLLEVTSSAVEVSVPISDHQSSLADPHTLLQVWRSLLELS